MVDGVAEVEVERCAAHTQGRWTHCWWQVYHSIYLVLAVCGFTGSFEAR